MKDKYKGMKLEKSIIRKIILRGSVILLVSYFLVNIGFIFGSEDIKKCKNNCIKWISSNSHVFSLNSLSPDDINPILGNVETINDLFYKGSFDIKLPSGEFRVEFIDEGEFRVQRVYEYKKRGAFVVRDTLIWKEMEKEFAP